MTLERTQSGVGLLGGSHPRIGWSGYLGIQRLTVSHSENEWLEMSWRETRKRMGLGCSVENMGV